MSLKSFPNCFTPAEVESYRDVFEMELRGLAQMRKAMGEPYSDGVAALLHDALKPPRVDKSGNIVPSNDRINGVREHPVSLWVTKQCHQDAVLEQAWSVCRGKVGGLDRWAEPAPVQALMRKERAWRFWGQYVLTCFKVLSDETELCVPKTTVKAAQEFVDGAVKVTNALSALLADPRVLMGVCPQEVPAMRVLRQVLPDLIATFEEIDVSKLYPYKNMRADAKSRTVARDIAELAWRNLGHCDARVLAKLLSELEMSERFFDDKWHGEQSGKAKQQLDAYESRRYVLNPNLPLNQAEDLYRPCLTDSPWLGTFRDRTRKGTVNRVFEGLKAE